jgi:hypothetical protein
MHQTDWRTTLLRYSADDYKKYSYAEGQCHGECGRLGHGVWDATTDLEVVAKMWSGRRADCNVSCRVPDKLLLIDVDPRHGGQRTWQALLAKYGPWPDCEIHASGRGDGGAHLWVGRPPGKLTDARLGRGVEVKHHGGAAVLPPSLHGETGMPYVRIDGPLPIPPDWFVELITVPPPLRRPRQFPPRMSAPSVADAFCARQLLPDCPGLRSGNPSADQSRRPRHG